MEGNEKFNLMGRGEKANQVFKRNLDFQFMRIINKYGVSDRKGWYSAMDAEGVINSGNKGKKLTLEQGNGKIAGEGITEKEFFYFLELVLIKDFTMGLKKEKAFAKLAEKQGGEEGEIPYEYQIRGEKMGIDLTLFKDGFFMNITVKSKGGGNFPMRRHTHLLQQMKDHNIKYLVIMDKDMVSTKYNVIQYKEKINELIDEGRE